MVRDRRLLDMVVPRRIHRNSLQARGSQVGMKTNRSRLRTRHPAWVMTDMRMKCRAITTVDIMMVLDMEVKHRQLSMDSRAAHMVDRILEHMSNRHRMDKTSRVVLDMEVGSIRVVEVDMAGANKAHMDSIK